jgi:hypothetical protein
MIQSPFDRLPWAEEHQLFTSPTIATKISVLAWERSQNPLFRECRASFAADQAYRLHTDHGHASHLEQSKCVCAR